MDSAILAMSLVLALLILAWRVPPLTRFLLIRSRSNKMPTEVEHLRILVREKDTEIQRLTNLLFSKSPMEFQALQGLTPSQIPTGQVMTPTGFQSELAFPSDAEEYAIWAAQQKGPYIPAFGDAGFDGQ